MTSEHAVGIPAESMKKPENLLNITVGCYECHSLNASNHKDNFEHFDFRINVVVTPKDCATCHQEEVDQYLPSKKANAHFNLEKNTVYHTLVETITSVKNSQNGDILQRNSSEDAKAETCLACHGTSWVTDHFARFHSTLKETDRMVETSTRIILDAWEQGLADRSNPFDESLEQKWVSQWLFYANSVRYASAMMGPDYAAFKNGWWYLTKNLQEMKDLIALKTAIKK